MGLRRFAVGLSAQAFDPYLPGVTALDPEIRDVLDHIDKASITVVTRVEARAVAGALADFGKLGITAFVAAAGVVGIEQQVE